MDTNAIEQFLQSFNDSALTRLGMDAMEGRVPYADSTRCLLAHHQNGYAVNHASSTPGLAEYQYNFLYEQKELADWAIEHPHAHIEFGADQQRTRNLLPLIDAEWKRRKLERQQAEAVKPVEEKVEELVCV